MANDSYHLLSANVPSYFSDYFITKLLVCIIIISLPLPCLTYGPRIHEAPVCLNLDPVVLASRLQFPLTKLCMRRAARDDMLVLGIKKSSTKQVACGVASENGQGFGKQWKGKNCSSKDSGVRKV